MAGRKNVKAGGWPSWDLEQISPETNISENVVALSERKIKHIPACMQHILLVAAHLGFHFEFDVLETVFFESKSSAEEANIELMDDAKLCCQK